jgi:hypothetical protein
MNCKRVAILALSLAASAQIGAAQVWIASTGTVDTSSVSTYLFVGQFAYVRPSVKTGSVTLRYNVLPAGDLLTPITQPCCQGRALLVRFLDNGSGAQVIVTLKQYNVHTGQLTTLETFNSNDYPPQPTFQEGLPNSTVLSSIFHLPRVQRREVRIKADAARTTWKRSSFAARQEELPVWDRLALSGVWRPEAIGRH